MKPDLLWCINSVLQQEGPVFEAFFFFLKLCLVSCNLKQTEQYFTYNRNTPDCPLKAL